MEANMTGLLSKEAVIEILGREWRPKASSEAVSVTEALGRIPARDLFSVNSIPLVRSAAMDGWAVKSALFAGGLPDASKWALGRDYARADMGDDFDDGFDSVVLVEEARQEGEGLSFSESLNFSPGQNVRQAGAQIAEGDLLAKAGRPLLPKDLAMLQMGGLSVIEVFAKPRFAFIPSGNELIAPGPRPARGENIDTNSVLVSKTLEGWGAKAELWPIIPDDPEKLSKALDEALDRSDVVILNGGSSKGGDDRAGSLLAARGRSLVRGVAAAPGKPMGVFLVGDKLAVNLPGPMIAAYYGLEWCLKWIVARFQGLKLVPRPKVKAVLLEDLKAPESLSFLFNVSLSRNSDGSWSARPVDPRRARTAEGVAANGQYMSVLGRGAIPKGEEIWVEVLRDEEILGE
jgi:molybdopterin molybdotransferase/putative molybdopterin biosynthesis protein